MLAIPLASSASASGKRSRMGRALPVIRGLMSQLGLGREVAALVTRDGTLTKKGREVLGPHVFGVSAKALARDEEVDERDLAARFDQHRSALLAMPLWYRALLSAHQEWVDAGHLPISTAPNQKLLLDALLLAQQHGEASPEVAPRIASEHISIIASSVTLTEIGLDHAFSDAEFAASLLKRLQGIEMPTIHRAEPVSIRERNRRNRMQRDVLESFAMTAGRTAVNDDAETSWRAFLADEASTAPPSALELASSSPPAPRLVDAVRVESSDWLPLDASVRARFERMLQGKGRFAAYTVDPRDAWIRAVDAVASPFALSRSSWRATLVLGAAGMTAVTFEPGEDPASKRRKFENLPQGARIMAKKWSNVRLFHVLHGLQLTPPELSTFSCHPHQYMLGRLWTRLYRLHFTSDDELTAADAWAQIHGAFTSTMDNIPTVFARALRTEKHGLDQSSLTVAAADSGEEPETNQVRESVSHILNSALAEQFDETLRFLDSVKELGDRRRGESYGRLQKTWYDMVAMYLRDERPFREERHGARYSQVPLTADDLPAFGQAVPVIQSILGRDEDR